MYICQIKEIKLLLYCVHTICYSKWRPTYENRDFFKDTSQMNEWMNQKAVDLNALSKCFNRFSGNNINQKLFQYLLTEF